MLTIGSPDIFVILLVAVYQQPFFQTHNNTLKFKNKQYHINSIISDYYYYFFKSSCVFIMILISGICPWRIFYYHIYFGPWEYGNTKCYYCISWTALQHHPTVLCFSHANFWLLFYMKLFEALVFVVISCTCGSGLRFWPWGWSGREKQIDS